MIFNGEATVEPDQNAEYLYITMPIKKLTPVEMERVSGKKAMVRLVLME